MNRLEIYNLAEMSHVKVSFELPLYTGDVDAIGTLRLIRSDSILLDWSKKWSNRIKIEHAIYILFG